MATANPEHYKKHISGQFNAELEDIRQRVLAMGGLVEQQVADAVRSMLELNIPLADEVMERDHKVNAQEVAIDEECTRILARRQPAASDLRLVMACIKTTTDLERIGDEAERIARMAKDLAQLDSPRGPHFEVETLGSRVGEMLHRVLDAFARMDTDASALVSHSDRNVDREYEAILRQCITFMIEEPRAISRVLDIVWAIRSLERIGDHAKNIAEYIVYFVHGKDVRHISPEEMQEKIDAKG
ncbi:MAG: phosphate signaling complex protein PhoU [Oceanococcaceae bacterium]